MSVILANDLSVSYFTYNDEYWTVYYVKPYARIPVFLIGILAGCSFFTWKHEDPESQAVAKIYEVLKQSKIRAILTAIIGFLLCFMMVLCMQIINNKPNEGATLAGNLFYLLLSRPIYIVGTSMVFIPMLVDSPVFKSLSNFLAHQFWTPFSRLSYGAFLSHGVFMQFREFNSERGQWGSAFDAVLFFLAYCTFSYLFAFLMALVIEMPIHNVYMHFIYKKQPNVEEAFYNSNAINDEDQFDYA